MSNDINEDEYEILSLLHKGLTEDGSDFPKNIEEVEKIENYITENQISIPEHLKDPINAFKRRRNVLDNTINFPQKRNEETFHYFAQAAREGGEISDSVKEKMKCDREEAEKGRNE